MKNQLANSTEQTAETGHEMDLSRAIARLRLKNPESFSFTCRTRDGTTTPHEIMMHN
jgi:hypothetical protein